MENPTSPTGGGGSSPSGGNNWAGATSLILPAASLLYGAFQSWRSHRQLKKLAKQNFEYKATPESKMLLGIAHDNTQHGFNAAQRGAFTTANAGNIAKSYRVGTTRFGNNAANIIGAGNDISNSNAWNQFANADANQQRMNQGIYAQLVAQEQSRQNQNVNMGYQNNIRAQQAFGMAGQQGINNIGTGLQMGSMVLGNMGKDGTNNTQGATGYTPTYEYGKPVMTPRPTQYGLPYQNNSWQLPPDNAVSPVFRQNYQT